MKVIEARNVHQALPKALRLLQLHGQPRPSRNGDVLVAPWPVTTVYEQPTERLTFWPQRDVNTAFLLAEALWMLQGRNDLGLPQRYIKDFGRYSDDGQTLLGRLRVPVAPGLPGRSAGGYRGPAAAES